MHFTYSATNFETYNAIALVFDFISEEDDVKFG